MAPTKESFDYFKPFRRDGVWYTRIKERGKLRKVSLRYRGDSEKEARRLAIERQRGSGHAPDHAATLAEALARFIDTKRGANRADGTLSMYAVKSRQLVRVIGANENVRSVTARTVDDYVATRREESACNGTIGKELTTLRGALRIAWRRGEFDQDPKLVMPIGWSDGYVPRKTYLTEEEATRLLDVLSVERAAHVAFILATSARDGEVSRAQWADLDLKRGFVHLRGTKTESSRRTVPVTILSKPLLDRVLLGIKGGSRRLFRPWTNQRRDLALACRKAGVPSITANDLRRTCATWLVQRGVEPYLVGKVLGHRDARMVERVYGQVSPLALGKLVADRLTGTRLGQNTLAKQEEPDQ